MANNKSVFSINRSTKFGNPFTIKEAYIQAAFDLNDAKIEYKEDIPKKSADDLIAYARAIAKKEFESHMENHPELVKAAIEQLRGKNLACWCRIGEWCHADMLLEIANK